MKLSEIKEILGRIERVDFQLENGTRVPENFHVTEVGTVVKTFIDCGGKKRTENRINFQLWNADDYEHRLKPGKLLHIIQLCQEQLGMEDGEIEVEFQSETIGRYDLDFKDAIFILKNKKTACLAEDSCGISIETEKPILKMMGSAGNSCDPNGGCC